MPIVGKAGIKIDRIRRAGVSRVREAALGQGATPERWKRDYAIIKAVANGSINTAAAKCGVGRCCVEYVLKKYSRIAETILDDDKRRHRRDAAGR